MALPFSNVEGDDRAVMLVAKRFLTGEKSAANQKSKFDKWFRMYKNERVDSNYKGFSNIVVPKVFEKIERGTAILSQAIKRIKVTGQGPEDKASADLNEKLIEFEDRALNIPQIRKQWIKTSRIHGIGYLKCTWDVAKETPERPYKGISVSLPDPRLITFNPDWTPDQDPRWAIHEATIPFSDVAKNSRYSKDKLAKVKESSTYGKKPYAIRGVKKALDTSDDTTLMTNIKEYYGPYSDKEDGDEYPAKIIIANDLVALEVVENPYAKLLDCPIPIFPLSIYVVPHDSAPMGDPEAIASLYTELNDTRNQRLDTVTLNIDPMKLVLKAAQIDESELVAKKGWIVHSNLPNGVQVIPPDMQGVVAAINEERIIQGDIDRTLGIPSFGAETPVSGDITTDTATGVNATLQAQDIISNSILEEVKAALKKVYRAILAYNQSFIDRQFIISVVGQDNQPQPTTVSPERIQGNMDLDVEVELVGNRLARRAEALQALTVGSKIPGTNMGKLWEDYLRTHDKYDIKEYYTPPQPAPPESPKVSVALKGDLTQLQASQVYSQIPGVNQKFADPIMTPEGRAMMRGELPEYQDKDDKQLEALEKQANILHSFRDRDLKAEELKVRNVQRSNSTE